MDTFCSKCGSSLTADDNFCPQCGKPISSSALVINTPSNTPTIPALPFKNTLPMTSTDYGSNPYGVTASNPYNASPLKPPPPPLILRNNRPSILVGVVLLILILGNISTWVIFIHGTRSNANTAFATATSISNTNETLLYSADWSHGLNGWTGTSDWTVLNGMLHNDGTDGSSNSPTMVAPFQVVGITVYAVEIHMQVVTGNNCFDVTTLRASGSGNIWQGYKATFCGDNAIINAGTITGGSFDRLAQVHFDDGNTWHTFRFEAKGTRLSYLIDGELIVGLNDSRYSSGGQLGFKSAGTQLESPVMKVGKDNLKKEFLPLIIRGFITAGFGIVLGLPYLLMQAAGKHYAFYRYRCDTCNHVWGVSELKKLAVSARAFALTQEKSKIQRPR